MSHECGILFPFGNSEGIIRMSDDIRAYPVLRSGVAVEDQDGKLYEVVCDLLNGQVRVRPVGAKATLSVRRTALSVSAQKPLR